MIAIGVTGTDTGVGKTVVGCALAAALVTRTLRVGVMKPVETGILAGQGHSDASRLAGAAQSHDDPSLICPFRFPAPLAPLLAARAAGVTVDLGRLDRALRAISAERDAVIVEGAGGLLVPITETCDVAALFSRWRLGLIVVAPNRLGVVNHVLLTLRAARSATLTVGAIVLHDLGPVPADESAAGNATLLSEFAGGIPIVRFPWIRAASDHQELAHTAEVTGLVQAVAPSLIC